MASPEGQGRDHPLDVGLGDRRDSFVNKSDSPAEVHAQDGEVDRITCGTFVGPFDLVWADPQDVIVTPVRCDYVTFEPAP